MYAESTYLIRGTLYRGDSPALQAALAEVYGTDERPRCLCVEHGIEMYVAQHAQLVIKRMPGTGPAHHPSCPSYEAPASETGLGDLLGEAVIERGPERVEVRLDFPLSHVSVPRPAQAPSAPSQSVSAAQRRLSMRGLLHLLWDRAGFSRWSPRMEGKRTWFVIRKYLLEAAGEIDAKGAPLASRLFIPEPFRPDDSGGAEGAAGGLLRRIAARCRRRPRAARAARRGGEGPDRARRRLLDGAQAPARLPARARQHDRPAARAALRARAAREGAAARHAAHRRVHDPARGGGPGTRRHARDDGGDARVDALRAPARAGAARRARAAAAALPEAAAYEAGPSAAFASALLLDTGDAPVPLHVEAPSAVGQRRPSAGDAGSALSPKTWVWRPAEALLMPALPRASHEVQRAAIS